MENKNKSPNGIQQQMPLHDIELELNIVGTMLQAYISAEQMNEVREIISPEMFYDDTCRNTFALMCKMVDDGETVDATTVMMHVLSDANISQEKFVNLMMHQYVSYVECVNKCHILAKYATRRNIWALGQKLIAVGLNLEGDEQKILADSHEELDKLQESVRIDNFRTMQDVLGEFNGVVSDNLSGKNNKRRTTTGFSYLDRKGGLQSSDLVIVAGSTSAGKTSFTNSVVFNAIVEGAKVAFYSLEMTSLQLTSRMLSKYTNIPSNRMLTSPLSTNELKQFDEGVGKIWECSGRLFFDDMSTSSIDNILSSIRRMKSKHDISGVAIDYLQLISGQEKGQNKEQFMASCARRLKNIAKELDIWIIALSQLNRDRENPMPSIDRMRDSGQIAEAADIVMMVYRPQYYNEVEGKNLSYPSPNENVSTRGTALILIEKGRNVGTGSFVCGFNSSTTCFYDLDTLPLKTYEQPSHTELAEQKRRQEAKQEVLPF